ncbi:hypothetical protein [Barnesiella viscericola]|uniref:hypothetical protein n=1 Tax=Barnesiella viscericola TaxID=397865 RepID=UPI00373FCC06
MGNGNSDNNFGDTNGSAAEGWQRTISVPAGTEAGTYRMRVVYMAPTPIPKIGLQKYLPISSVN